MKELIQQSESIENSEATEHSETTQISEQTFPGDNTSISDMESELQTDQSVQGSPIDHSAAMENSSPTNSGPDSEAASIDDLPRDETKATNEEGYIPEDISNKMAAATTYMGSFFNPSAWKAEKSPEGGEAKEGKPAGTSRKNSAAGGMMGSSFLSAFGKVPGFTKVSPTEEEKPTKEGEAREAAEGDKVEEEKEESAAQGSFFSSAFSKIGISGMASSLTMENIAGKSAPAATTDTEEDKDQESKESDDKKDETWGSSFSSAFTKVGKVATDYTKVVQDTVYKAPMLAEFNQEQEEFIKSKGEKEMPTAPWSGYQNEDELKDKILALSEDKRNFLRAPPTGVNFDFEYSAVASHAVVLLEADPRLQKMRYELVPKKVKEDEFWRNYFYRVGLVKQSFELSNSMSTDVKKEKKAAPKPVDDDSDNQTTSAEHDDEFVSDLHQASSKDLAEADEAMKKLGLSKNDTEWEAELEGELNEYEMVGEDVEGAENPEWENQIQEMLEAESKK
eukprot:TRINITY_DN2258_c0_g1_i1.p1 TRINITY_DN2258_c0_g1~~TRINITY_DN2258_c0_g1_i1.p1  ORF type:complete len:507 (-),score=199.74 TRINITY_DN2258_c0_g1_i1:528-2048(-)